ncbi:MAG: hypothetical protein IH984_08265 [Planctomycetes bacterium]|nr:hypothetical protein [Planctomycetota bacterium]
MCKKSVPDWLREMEHDAIHDYLVIIYDWIARLADQDKQDEATKHELVAGAKKEISMLRGECASLCFCFPDVKFRSLPDPTEVDHTTTFYELVDWLRESDEALKDVGKPLVTGKTLKIARVIFLHRGLTSERYATLLDRRFNEPTNDSAVRRAISDVLIHWGFESTGTAYHPPRQNTGKPWERPVIGVDDNADLI